MSHDPIARIRAIVRANPTITVRDLAREMGYAEDRSIYYWLHKTGFKGLKDFKASVLKGVQDGSSAVRKKDDDLVGEPPGHAYESKIHTIETMEYSPWLLPGDKLVWDPNGRPRDGNLVLVRTSGPSLTVRRYVDASPPILIHPANPYDLTRLDGDEHPSLYGRVVRLIRELP